MENNELITEETIPTEEATVQDAEVNTETDNDTNNAEDENISADGTENTDTQAAEDTFTIRYMHEDVNISMDEARRLAQLGRHYEENVKKSFDLVGKETLDNLDYVATLQGKTVKELVEGLVNGVDSAYKDELIAELGADNPLIEEMLEFRRSKNNKAYEDAKAERSTREKAAEEEAQKSATAKLAEQFEGLRDLFPEYDTVEKVPDTVIKKALKSGDLEKELLRYEKTEKTKVEAAKALAEKNQKNDIGSVKSTENESGISEAFMKGLWG